MSDRIEVDVWSDVACPWCYIGKRRLEQAITDFGGDDATVEVRFRSFQLAPETPEDFEGTATEYLARRKGLPEAQVRQMHERVSEVAATVGLQYDFDALKPTNTLKAHQLLHLAKARGVQPEVKERLLRAHFVEGRHVGRDEVLADLAAEEGLDRDEVLRSLREEDHLPGVQEDLRLAARIGIRGVPFFVIDGRYGISGAQPSELFLQALEQAKADRGEGSAA